MVQSTEQLAPRTQRKVGGDVKSSGLAGVFKRLVAEHSELTKLLIELRLSSDLTLREQLFPTVREAVLCHERAEAQIVYLAMSKKEQTRQIAAKHHRTAGELETLVERLSALDYSSPSWESTFGLLFDAFEQHTIEEESYFFPIAQRVLGEGKAEALLSQYDTAHGSSQVRRTDEFSYARDAVRAAISTRRGGARSQHQ